MGTWTYRCSSLPVVLRLNTIFIRIVIGCAIRTVPFALKTMRGWITDVQIDVACITCFFGAGSSFLRTGARLDARQETTFTRIQALLLLLKMWKFFRYNPSHQLFLNRSRRGYLRLAYRMLSPNFRRTNDKTRDTFLGRRAGHPYEFCVDHSKLRRERCKMTFRSSCGDTDSLRICHFCLTHREERVRGDQFYECYFRADFIRVGT